MPILLSEILFLLLYFAIVYGITMLYARHIRKKTGLIELPNSVWLICWLAGLMTPGAVIAIVGGILHLGVALIGA
jgi:uncharacterized membrane protein YozB (DUF420 family)